MAAHQITVSIDLEGDLTHHNKPMDKTSENTTWQAGFEIRTAEFVCAKGCGATATFTSREPVQS